MSEIERDNSHNRTILRILRSPLFAIASGIGIILFALAFGTIKEKLSFEGLLIGAGLFLLIAVMNMVVNALVNRVDNQEYFDDRLEILNSIILANNLNWLVNQKYIQQMERQAKEIWAFAPELTYSIQPGTDLFMALQYSLKNGTRYKIFMPNKPETLKIISDYRRLHEFKAGQVEFILIPNEDYVFHTIITLYDPRSADPKAIEWLPVENLISWLEMDHKHASRMVGIGETLLQRYVREGVATSDLIKELPHRP